jgi:hypothetical protein
MLKFSFHIFITVIPFVPSKKLPIDSDTWNGGPNSQCLAAMDVFSLLAKSYAALTKAGCFS